MGPRSSAFLLDRGALATLEGALEAGRRVLVAEEGAAIADERAWGSTPTYVGSVWGDGRSKGH